MHRGFPKVKMSQRRKHGSAPFFRGKMTVCSIFYSTPASLRGNEKKLRQAALSSPLPFPYPRGKITHAACASTSVFIHKDHYKGVLFFCQYLLHFLHKKAYYSSLLFRISSTHACAALNFGVSRTEENQFHLGFWSRSEIKAMS